MKSLLLLHLVFIGVWLGCVLTEALFERALLGKGHESELLLAQLHKRVDLFVEVPAFLVVLLTGGFMLRGASADPELAAKVGVGAVAIATNVYCVWLVFRRSAHASAGNWEAFAKVDRLQHKFGAIVLVALLLALGIGLHRHAGA